MSDELPSGDQRRRTAAAAPGSGRPLMTPELSDRHDVHPDDRDLERPAVDYLNPAQRGARDRTIGAAPKTNSSHPCGVRPDRCAITAGGPGPADPDTTVDSPTRPGKAPTACGPGSTPTPLPRHSPQGHRPPTRHRSLAASVDTYVRIHHRLVRKHCYPTRPVTSARGGPPEGAQLIYRAPLAAPADIPSRPRVLRRSCRPRHLGPGAPTRRTWTGPS